MTMTVLPIAVPTTAAPGSTTDAPAHLLALGRRIEERLDALLRAESERWAGVDRDLVDPLASLHRLVLVGGKRLRPAFCHWGFAAAGGALDEPAGADVVERAGVAFELLHAFALVHDDVMDDAGTRRGEPTVHVEHEHRHRGSAWRGDRRRFGEGIAILVGDLAHVLADRVMGELPAGAVAVWRELQVELLMGQYLDVLGTARGDRSKTKADLVLQLKSGRYSIERPLEIGAALAAATGAPRGRATDRLPGYGQPLGRAFQLRDDLLGAFGSPATTGKPVGDDLREGKPTVLLAHARAQGRPAQRVLLDRAGAPGLTDDEVAGLQQVLEDTGARAAAEREVERLTAEAVAVIDAPDVPGPARAALIELAHFVAARRH